MESSRVWFVDIRGGAVGDGDRGSGSRGAGGPKDEARDLAGMGDQRQMAGVDLDRCGPHAFGHEALKVGVDGPILTGHCVEIGP